MQVFELDKFTGGWVVGDFEPSLLRLPSAEVAIKRYKQYDREDKHVHRIAEEITIVVEGIVLMNGHILKRNDVVLLNAGEATDFMALTDAVTCVIKSPSIKGDKYLV